MIGLVLIYILGKFFYELAERFNKSKWGYAVLGVLSYYGGSIVGAVILFILMDVFGATEDVNETLIEFLAIPFGLLSCWLFYRYLKKQWENKNEDWKDDVLDGDFFEE